jgi:hypothetical protein
MKQPPWWVRLIARVLRAEVERGHVRLNRALTYHECLQAGCTTLEALDYVRDSHAVPFSLVWRGHELWRTDVQRPPSMPPARPFEVGEEFSL